MEKSAKIYVAGHRGLVGFGNYAPGSEPKGLRISLPAAMPNLI